MICNHLLPKLKSNLRHKVILFMRLCLKRCQNVLTTEQGPILSKVLFCSQVARLLLLTKASGNFLYLYQNFTSLQTY